jgi:hypothetical protein
LKKPVNRLYLSFSWCFEDEKVILAPSEVVGEGNVRIYEPFVCSDYLEFIESSERGKFEKVGFTVKHFARITLGKSWLENPISKFSPCIWSYCL